MTESNYVLYDGDCFLCQNYIRFSRLQKHQPINVLNARDHLELVQDLFSKGYDIDKGLVLFYQGQLYHSDQAMHMLSLLTSDSKLVNLCMPLFFGNRKRAKLFYPFFVLARNFSLFLKRKKQFQLGDQ